MPTGERSVRKKLTTYETEQVGQIAAWKARPPNPLAQAWNLVALQAAKPVTFLVPDVAVRAAMQASYRAAHALAPPESLARAAGVTDVKACAKDRSKNVAGLHNRSPTEPGCSRWPKVLQPVAAAC